MPNVSTGTTAINFGSSLRIGFRQTGSVSAFTYIVPYPGYDQLPFLFAVPSTGSWEIEYTEICPNCSGGLYADPITTSVIV